MPDRPQFGLLKDKRLRIGLALAVVGGTVAAGCATDSNGSSRQEYENGQTPVVRNFAQNQAASGENSYNLSAKYFPDFSLPDLSGNPVSIYSFKGRNVIIFEYYDQETMNNDQLNAIRPVAQSHPDIIFIPVVNDRNIAPAASGFNGPTLVKVLDNDSPLMKYLKVGGYPSTVFINRNGQREKTCNGVTSTNDLERLASALETGQNLDSIYTIYNCS